MNDEWMNKGEHYSKRLCREDPAQFCTTRLFAKHFDKRGWTHNQESPADMKKVDL
jgi:hypothetical protein